MSNGRPLSALALITLAVALAGCWDKSEEQNLTDAIKGGFHGELPQFPPGETQGTVFGFRGDAAAIDCAKGRKPPAGSEHLVITPPSPNWGCRVRLTDGKDMFCSARTDEGYVFNISCGEARFTRGY